MQINFSSCFGAIGRIVSASILGLAIIGAAPSVKAATELFVYSAMEPDEVSAWREAFEKDNPDIKLEIVRSSTGTTTSRILAEKDNPRHDVIWRLANTSLIVLANQGLIEPYTPNGIDKLDPRFVDQANKPAHWVGNMGYMAAVCFNTIEAEKLGLKEPKSWKDLLDPAYTGYLAAPNPSASGTGFINMATWVKLWGEDKAFEYMDALDKNIKFYLDSGSSPCTKAASGEVPIALSWGRKAATLITKGAPLKFLTFKEGMGWDLEGSAIRKGTPKMDAAKRFLDWTISRNAMDLYAQQYSLVGLKSARRPVENFPPDAADTIISYDFVFNAENRDRLIKKWLCRYHSKAMYLKDSNKARNNEKPSCN